MLETLVINHLPLLPCGIKRLKVSCSTPLFLLRNKNSRYAEASLNNVVRDILVTFCGQRKYARL